MEVFSNSPMNRRDSVIIIQYVFWRHRPLKTCLSDRGLNFTRDLLNFVFETLNIDKKESMVYDPMKEYWPSDEIESTKIKPT